jgi:hypothetical protein
MSVPGRIGIILIIVLALVDGLILASGARRAATAIETHSMTEETAAVRPVKHDQLLSTAIREINLWTKPAPEKSTGI